MLQLLTPRGKTLYLVSYQSLWRPISSRTGRVRAYCHLHGSDHQRSLCIDPASGWGRCYGCGALIVVVEYQPALAQDLQAQALEILSLPDPLPPAGKILPLRRPPLPSAGASPHPSADWQVIEQQALQSAHPLLRQALGDFGLGDCWQAQAYLESRQIPLELAQEAGLGYLSQELLTHPDLFPHQQVLGRWSDRLLFPLRSPSGNGFVGRSLWRWQLGMNEATHQALLHDEPQAPARWLKSRPAGWFGLPPVQWGAWVVVVEGGFDALALLAAGGEAQHLVALAGTDLRVDWLPPQVRSVILALDSDLAGVQATERLVPLLEAAGRSVVRALPPPDGLGTDWSARWRTAGHAGLAPLWDQVATLGDRPAAA